MFKGRTFLGLILLSVSLATILFLCLDTFLLLATQGLDHSLNVALDRPRDLLEKVKIYVVSLPDRQSRRAEMEILRAALGLRWVYSDAIPAENPLVIQILNWVAQVRSPKAFADSSAFVVPKFSWPQDIDDVANSDQEIPLLSSTVWRLPTIPPLYQPLTCNKNDYDMPDFSPGGIPEYMRLTPARVACWHSHLSVIHQHANTGYLDIALILEDDVDMEKNTIDQMKSLWSDLPPDWDMVFLGHCWSDETRGRLVKNTTEIAGSRLYISTKPKCTHAYAVSRIGARRLLLHLTYPLFAYSRAIDQAFAWLVESGRIRSFSIVPSLAIQRKIAPSDVTMKSQWKDTLVDGVFATVEHPH